MHIVRTLWSIFRTDFCPDGDHVEARYDVICRSGSAAYALSSSHARFDRYRDAVMKWFWVIHKRIANLILSSLLLFGWNVRSYVKTQSPAFPKEKNPLQSDNDVVVYKLANF